MSGFSAGPRFFVPCLLLPVGLAAAGCADRVAASGDVTGTTDAAVPADTADAKTGEAARQLVAWEVHYDTGRVLRYDLTIAPADLEAMLADPRCSSGATPCGSEYVHGTLRFEGVELTDVGIRFKGNSSLDHVVDIKEGEPGFARYSFKVKTDEFVKGQKLDGIGTFNFHNGFLDPSLVREHLAYRAFRDAGVPASLTAFADLWVNGERWGLYISVQEVDKAFLRQHFGGDEGNLYKPDYGPLVYQGAAISDYDTTVRGEKGTIVAQVSGEEAYVKKTNKKAADYSDIIALMDVLTNAPDEGFEEKLRAVLDVDRFLDALAVYAVIVALDGYGGGLPQNYYLYRVPATDRFTFIPWDLNNAFGTFDCFLLSDEQVLHLNPREPYCLGVPDALGEGLPLQAANRPLIGRLLSVPALRDACEARIRALLSGLLAPEVLTGRMDEAHALIGTYVADDPRLFYDFDEFARSLEDPVGPAPGLKPFVQDRTAILQGLLDHPVACEDGTCAAAENCPADCQVGCKPCETWFEPKSMCVPSCAGGCKCPPNTPDGSPLTCDEQAGICHP